MARTLEGEAGLNDPVAVLLVLALVELILHPDFGALGVVGLFAKELAIGAAVGLALPRLLIPLVRRSGSAPLGIHFLGSLGALTIAYGGAAALGGSGFLAVYLAGLMLGGSDLPQEQPVRVFHQGLVQLAEVALFLTLGLLVFASQIPEVFVAGFVLALVVAFIARPLAAAVALAFPRYSARERLVIGWAGLRGGMPVVLAVLAVVAGVPRSVEFFTVAFFAVLVSTLIQGITVTPLARRLGVAGSGRAGRVDRRSGGWSLDGLGLSAGSGPRAPSSGTPALARRLDPLHARPRLLPSLGSQRAERALYARRPVCDGSET